MWKNVFIINPICRPRLRVGHTPGWFSCSACFLWLEITVFQVYTAIVFVIFLIAAILQIARRKIVLEDDGVAIKTVFSMNAKKISYDDILNVEVEKHGLAFHDQISEIIGHDEMQECQRTVQNFKQSRKSSCLRRFKRGNNYKMTKKRRFC